MTTAKKITVKKLDQGRKGEVSAFLNECLNVNSDGGEVTSEGKSFQMRAPATRKARRPTVESLTAGTSR